MKTVAVVPMKLNNTRLPQKNIRLFKNGHPLCWYILDTLLQCQGIDDVYVYCSNDDICQYIPPTVQYLKRDISLDQDTTKMNEVLTAFAKDVFADVYIMAHATAPFVSVESFQKGMEAVIHGGYDSAFTVKKMQDFIWKDNRPFNYKLDSIPRTQDLEPLYVETSGYYIYKRNIILEHNRRIGFKPYLVEVDEIEGCDIDEYNDFLIADAIQYYKQCEDKANE
ncbi:MAG: acylneuraminate cytidylyltransferase family protein [Epulopiscium sp.]|nr:acylneuraminate cytidylyltransferase family protein [Candidatus Epulonipiscium sp.]